MPAEDVNVEHNYPKERAKNAARKVPKCPTELHFKKLYLTGLAEKLSFR